MIKNYVQHEYTSWFRMPTAKDTLKLRLKTDKKIKRAIAYFDSRFSSDPFPEFTKDMKQIGGTKKFNFFQIAIKVEDSRFLYCFKLFPQNGRPFWYVERGATYQVNELDHNDFFHYPYIRKEEIGQYPDWLKNAVIYQIFPERFAKGGSGSHDFSLNEWGTKPKRDSFFGGDLQGIIDKIGYLKELGINAIYLNPIFKSPSNHKYNIDDYYQIDENFGNFATARRLVKKAHKNGIKVIIDGVFNHTGDGFFAFQDLLNKGQKSEYQDWYYIDSFPVSQKRVNYETFGVEVNTMPRVNLNNEATANYFLEVIRFWTKKLNIDGWRMDVADEVPEKFWREARKIVKEINSECYLVGEIWYNSSPWLEGDQFDGIMNYRWRQNILDLIQIGRSSVQEFSSRIESYIFHNPPGALNRSLSMLDSHDTSRIAHEFRHYPELIRNKLIRQAVVFQFALPGIPVIFYGNEVGLEGDDDPDCRRCMIWKKYKQDRGLYNFYRRIIEFYRNAPALRTGNYREILADDINQLLVFARKKRDNRCLVAANTSADNTIVKQEFIFRKENNKSKVKKYFSLLDREYDFARDEIELPAKEILLIQT